MLHNWSVKSEYRLLPATSADEDWVDALTYKTMKPYVEASWAEEAERRRYYELNRFDLEHTKIIYKGARRIGRLTTRIAGETLELEEIHLIREFHGRGLGTRIIGDVIKEASAEGLLVELKCLKTNPVQKLYSRLGFRLINEDEKRLYYRLAPDPG